jgi:hypothetical protein
MIDSVVINHHEMPIIIHHDLPLNTTRDPSSLLVFLIVLEHVNIYGCMCVLCMISCI